jgi:hypothetical protein
VPTSLSAVLFAVVAGDPTVAARKLRFALRLSLMIGLPGMIVLAAGAHLLLSLFGPGYASDGTVPLMLLALGYPTTIPIALYIAVCRASGRITRAAVVLTTFSALDLGMAAAGAVYAGLIGMQLMLIAGRVVEALLLTPTVLRATFGHGRHRRTTNGVPAVVSSAPRPPAGGNGSRPPGPVPAQQWRATAGVAPRPGSDGPRTRAGGNGSRPPGPVPAQQWRATAGTPPRARSDGPGMPAGGNGSRPPGPVHP